jgi:hypothetical protein
MNKLVRNRNRNAIKHKRKNEVTYRRNWIESNRWFRFLFHSTGNGIVAKLRSPSLYKTQIKSPHHPQKKEKNKARKITIKQNKVIKCVYYDVQKNNVCHSAICYYPKLTQMPLVPFQNFNHYPLKVSLPHQSIIYTLILFMTFANLWHLKLIQLCKN